MNIVLGFIKNYNIKRELDTLPVMLNLVYKVHLTGGEYIFILVIEMVPLF